MRQMGVALHSRFNPSSMPPDLLEQTFVQRQDLVRRLVGLFEEGSRGESKHHVLLVGPRGIGKSHLVALVYHRLAKIEGVSSRLETAWLAEDEWGVTSFLDLVVKTLRALNVNTDELMTLPVGTVEKRAMQMVIDRIGGKTLLLIVENLDAILRNLGDAGQKKLRALLQDSGHWSILATTPALSEDIQRHASPFYGFFEIQHLVGLTDEEGIAMLHRLAVAQRKTELAQFLTTPGGRARVRTLQHLAQGNHRVLIVFYDFLDEDARQDLVALLWKTIDALTPYYQSQMKELSPQQRKLIEFLCGHRIPVTVKKIAAGCFVSHQTAAAQLKHLLEARYIRVERYGRESYYELSEPLLRICVEAKGHSGRPIPLPVELLRYWFSRKELEEQVRTRTDDWSTDYFKAALHPYEEDDGHSHLSLLVRESCARLSRAGAKGDATAQRAAAEELAEIAERDEDWLHYARALNSLGDPGRALVRIEQAVREQPDDPAMLAAVAQTYLECKKPQEALAAINRAVELDDEEDLYWDIKGDVLGELHQFDKALTAFLEAKRLNPKYDTYSESVAKMMFHLGKPREAARQLRGLVRRGIKSFTVIVNLGVTLLASGQKRQALVILEEASRLFPREPSVWVKLAQCRLSLGDTEAAFVAAARGGRLAKEDPDASRAVCLVLFRLGRHEEASETLPTEVLAHGVFHELVDRTKQPLRKNDLAAALRELQSRVDGSKWAAAFRGGIWEYVGGVAEQLKEASADELRALRDALTELNAAEPGLKDAASLVDVMFRYRETGDQRVLLELPLEQRSLLLPEFK